MRRYCLALDLKNDPQLIAEYEDHHKAAWPEVLENIHKAGVLNMEIYRVENRLFMIMEVTDDFSFEQQQAQDEANPKVQEWEALMWQYQAQIPGSTPGQKWRVMDLIFKTESNTSYENH